MSGVIDKHGMQWEHCSVCEQFVRLDDLGYERPTTKYECGRDICMACTNAHPNIESIEPARSWIAQYEGEPA